MSEKESVQNNFIRNKGRLALALAISLGMYLLASLLLSNLGKMSFPENTYDQDLFTVTKGGGELVWTGYTAPKGKFDFRDTTERMMRLRAGTKVKPLTSLGDSKFLVELPNGQRGLVQNTSLKVSSLVVAKAHALIFDRPEALRDEKEEIAEGTRAVVVDRLTKGKGIMADRYIKLRLKDGRTKWAIDKHFKIESPGEYAGRIFQYSTTLGLAQSHIIGKSQAEVESYYGMATYVDKTKGKHWAYLQGLTVVHDNGDHYSGVFVDFNTAGVATDIKYIGGGESRWLDLFPLVESLRHKELNRFLHWSLLSQSSLIPEWSSSVTDWYDGLRRRGWATGFVMFGFDLLIYLLSTILFYTLARVFVNPLLQTFTYIRLLNRVVIFLNTAVIFAATYAAFVLLVFLEDGFVFVGLIGLLVFARGAMKNLAVIQYNLCPECGTMYAGHNTGTDYLGRTTEIIRDKYRQNTHKSADGKTQYYEERIRKTTTDTEHYLDHQVCEQCDYSWNVDRDNSSSRTEG